MLATIVIGTIIAALVALAVVQMRKQGGTCDCGSCDQAEGCPGHTSQQ